MLRRKQASYLVPRPVACSDAYVFAGFIHLTRMMASTFAEAKIRVNCIAPGIFPSEMTAGSSGDDQKSSLDMEMSNPAGQSRLMWDN